MKVVGFVFNIIYKSLIEHKSDNFLNLMIYMLFAEWHIATH